MNDIFDDMFEQLNALFQPLNAQRSLANTGLKSVIRRPHNLYTIKSDDGTTTGYKIEIVTTPFKKEDVKVRVKDDILIVECGNNNLIKDDDQFLTYRGISAQSFNFSLKLDHIDKKAISAKVEDGILTVTMPIEIDKTEDALEIEIQ